MNAFEGAKWIWTEPERENQYVEFKAEFTARAGEDARLLISADTEYAAFINSRLAGFNQYDDFPFNKAYDSIDVTALLAEGENELMIIAYHQGAPSYQYLPGPAGVIFEIVGERRLVSSDESVLCRESALYKSGAVENISPQLAYTFHCDATDAEMDWLKAREVTERRETRLYPRPVKSSRRCRSQWELKSTRARLT